MLHPSFSSSISHEALAHLCQKLCLVFSNIEDDFLSNDEIFFKIDIFFDQVLMMEEE